MLASPLAFLTGVLAASSLLVDAAPVQKRCSATIASLSDVAAAKKCTSITIKTFTVPGGKTFDLTGLASGTKVTLAGDVTFTAAEWEGPLFSIDGSGVTFDGAGHTFDGQGAKLWDGKGSNGGKTKPKFLRVTNSGTFKNLTVKNSPRQVFSVGNKKGALVIDGVTIDNKDGDKLGSDGKALGHNSDCFDVSSTDTTIQNSFCYNQDDCLAINDATGTKFLNNYCSGGHGISIGSIQSGKNVQNVQISNNKVVGSTNGLRIKTVYGATKASVSDVTYSGNTVTGATSYGVVIQQDYENGSPTGKPTNGVSIKDINFTGTNTVSVSGKKGQAVYVLCGSGSCTGTWNWSGLKATEGSVKSSITPSSVPISGYKV